MSQSSIENSGEIFKNQENNNDENNLPIYDHLEIINERIDQFDNDINLQADILSDIKLFLVQADNKEDNLKQNEDLILFTNKIENDFKRMTEIENSESNFLKKQIDMLNKEKFRINQNFAILDERIKEQEIIFGTNHFYN